VCPAGTKKNVSEEKTACEKPRLIFFLHCFTGGGMARLAFVECRERGLSAAVLLRFVTEGDNAQPAVELGASQTKCFLSSKRRQDGIKRHFSRQTAFAI
jgi:hypothetical protein